MSPTTKLDPRYSDPAASAVSWEQTEAVLASAEISWICTVRPDGRPHVTPLVAVWLDGVLYFQTGEGEVKFDNLMGNPNVTLITGSASWDKGIDAIAEGEAVRVEDPELLGRLAEAWGRKWDGRWKLEPRGGGLGEPGSTGHAIVFAVAPKRVYAHAKGDPFGATTHQM